MPVQSQYQQSPQDLIFKIRDLEEKIRLLKDRVLLIGETYLEERDKNFLEIQELKKTTIKIEEENKKLKELLQRIAEQVNNSARKEELAILQRQFDLFRDR